VSVASDRCW